jgi:uncharacterized protein YpmB
MAEVHERVVVEKRGSGGTMIIALLLVAIIAVAAYFLVAQENSKDAAVEGAAQSVGQTADKIGGAVDDATGK